MRPQERRGLIVEAAFRAVAREGFEGLRTRDIAAAVGINSATLHHYFETKQDLIEGVAEHLRVRLETERAPRGGGTRPDPFGREFDDLIFYHREAPELLAVYREFVARAPRDAVIRRLVGELHAGWKSSIVTALERARTEGQVRSDIAVETAAGLVISIAWGYVAGIFESTKQLEAAAEQLRWLVQPSTTQFQSVRNLKTQR